MVKWLDMYLGDGVVSGRRQWRLAPAGAAGRSRSTVTYPSGRCALSHGTILGCTLVMMRLWYMRPYWMVTTMRLPFWIVRLTMVLYSGWRCAIAVTSVAASSSRDERFAKCETSGLAMVHGLFLGASLFGSRLRRQAETSNGSEWRSRHDWTVTAGASFSSDGVQYTWT